MKKLNLTCVGMRHHVTPTTLRKMGKECPLKIELRREPDNIHDENAVAVVCLEKPWKMKIGYVSRQTAAELAVRMDRGKVHFTEAWLTSADDESGVGEMLATAEITPRKKKSPGN